MTTPPDDGLRAALAPFCFPAADVSPQDLEAAVRDWLREREQRAFAERVNGMGWPHLLSHITDPDIRAYAQRLGVNLDPTHRTQREGDTADSQVGGSGQAARPSPDAGLRAALETIEGALAKIRETGCDITLVHSFGGPRLALTAAHCEALLQAARPVGDGPAGTVERLREIRALLDERSPGSSYPEDDHEDITRRAERAVSELDGLIAEIVAGPGGERSEDAEVPPMLPTPEQIFAHTVECCESPEWDDEAWQCRNCGYRPSPAPSPPSGDPSGDVAAQDPAYRGVPCPGCGHALHAYPCLADVGDGDACGCREFATVVVDSRGNATERAPEVPECICAGGFGLNLSCPVHSPAPPTDREPGVGIEPADEAEENLRDFLNHFYPGKDKGVYVARNLLASGWKHKKYAPWAAPSEAPGPGAGLTFESFSTTNLRRCTSPEGFNHTLDSWSLSDWFTALVGELGEAANVAKKLNRVRDGIPGNKQSVEELGDALAAELADTFIYLDLLVQRMGFTLAEIVPNTFNAKSDELGCSIRVESAPAPAPSAPPWEAARQGLIALEFCDPIPCVVAARLALRAALAAEGSRMADKPHDPTYNEAEIRANPVWDLAFTLSDIMNVVAPIGWSDYIVPAQCLMHDYYITRRAAEGEGERDG